MYIQQQCLLSFDEIIKYKPKTKLELILAELNFFNILKDLSKHHATRGPKGHDELALLYSLVAMQVEQITTFKKLVDRLTDPVFRYTCGFNILAETASASTFSRFLTKISNSPSLEKDFEELVKRAKSIEIIDGTNVAIESTKIDAYEKSKPKSELKNDAKSANWGSKRDTDGNTIRWFGYKLHILLDCKNELPLSILLSPASYSDCDLLAIPLIKKFLANYSGVLNPEYYIMNSGYDAQKNHDYISNQAKAQRIIALNLRGAYAPPQRLTENFEPVCSIGYTLTYWGKDSDYLKFRCPHITGKVNCPYGSMWCSKSNYGYCYKINYKKNNRYFCYPHRSTES